MADNPKPKAEAVNGGNGERQALVALNMVHGDRGLICALAQRLRGPGNLRCDSFAEEAAASLEASPRRVRTILLAARGRLDDAREEIARAAEEGVAIVTLFDPDYPPALADLGLQAPPVLYVRGRLTAAPGISIVGSRKADAYGLEVTAWFARRLAAAGLVVVSGFARGIDQAARSRPAPAPAEPPPCSAAASTSTTPATAGAPRPRSRGTAACSPSSRSAVNHAPSTSRSATGSSPRSASLRSLSAPRGAPVP